MVRGNDVAGRRAAPGADRSDLTGRPGGTGLTPARGSGLTWLRASGRRRAAETRPAQAHARRLAIAAVIGLLLAAPGGGWAPVVASETDPGGTPAIRSARRTPGPTTAGAMGRAMGTLLRGEPGVYGVAVVTPGGESLYTRNADVPFVAASLYKLFVMATVYEQEAAGSLTLDEVIAVSGTGALTISEAVRASIVYSDNAAALALFGRVGGTLSVNGLAQTLDLDQTWIAVDPLAVPGWQRLPAADSTAVTTARADDFVLTAGSGGLVDVTTPRDVATFFSLLLQGRVVSERASAEMVAVLKQQAVDDRFPVLLPAGAEVAHKTGNLTQVVHDAGIIYTPAGPVVLAALAEAMPDEARAAEVIQRLAAIAYDPFAAFDALGAEGEPSSRLGDLPRSAAPRRSRRVRPGAPRPRRRIGPAPDRR